MKRALLLTSALCMIAGTAFAGSLDGTVIALHSKAHSTKAITICTSSAPTVGCSDYATDNRPVGLSQDVYLVAAQAPVGVAGISCGIAFDANIGMFAWTLCADLDFPNGGWPGNGGGDRITWAAGSNCQTTVRGTDGIHAIGGAFYVYAYGNGVMSITPNNNLAVPELRVADCNAAESNVTCVGSVGFGTATGFNPCDPGCATPVESTTWGAIKGLGASE